jgi:hypothetical protein
MSRTRSTKTRNFSPKLTWEAGIRIPSGHLFQVADGAGLMGLTA